jgi:hypothetical protein
MFTVVAELPRGIWGFASPAYSEKAFWTGFSMIFDAEPSSREKL